MRELGDGHPARAVHLQIRLRCARHIIMLIGPLRSCGLVLRQARAYLASPAGV